MTHTSEAPTRRGLLAAALTAPAVLSAPALSFEAAPADTPILRLMRQHRALYLAPEAYADADEMLAYAEMDRLEAEIYALPTSCAADLAAKVAVFFGHGDHLSGGSPALWGEISALTA